MSTQQPIETDRVEGMWCVISLSPLGSVVSSCSIGRDDRNRGTHRIVSRETTDGGSSAGPAQSSTPGERLSDFVWLLERLSSRRLRRAARDGRVGFRPGGSGFEALSMSACSRRIARFRFVACERDRSSTMRISPPTLEIILDLVRSSNADDVVTSNRSSTRVELLFAC